MEAKQFKELSEMNEANRTLEATFFETQKGFDLVIKQAKYFYDRCLTEGFNEDQALKFMIKTFASGKE